MIRISASCTLNIKTAGAQKSADFFPRHRLAEYTHGFSIPLNCSNQAGAKRRLRSPELALWEIAEWEIAEVIVGGRAQGVADVARDVLE